MWHYTMERLHKFANSPSHQSLFIFLLASLDLGYQVHLVILTLYPYMPMNNSFIYS
jgi:hypothetical protein